MANYRMIHKILLSSFGNLDLVMLEANTRSWAWRDTTIYMGHKHYTKTEQKAITNICGSKQTTENPKQNRAETEHTQAALQSQLHVYNNESKQLYATPSLESASHTTRPNWKAETAYLSFSSRINQELLCRRDNFNAIASITLFLMSSENWK